MKLKRYTELCVAADAELTPEEMEQGYHWCPDWDFDLVKIGYIGCSCESLLKGTKQLQKHLDAIHPKLLP